LSSLKYRSFDLECEKPDCDIQTDEKNIGIEITEFVRSKEHCSKVRSVNTTLDRIRREAKSEIKQITDINLNLNFSQHSPPQERSTLVID